MPPARRHPVVEIFESLQGEGYWVGRPAVFLRFGGCNLRCAWCDTPTGGAEWLNPGEILGRIRSLSARSVIVTGGEPTLQPGLDELLDRLGRLSYWIGLETNGLLQPPNAVVERCDYIAVSPKACAAARYEDATMLRQADEVRIVVEDEVADEIASGTAGGIEAFCRSMRRRIRAARYYLSPCDRGGRMNIAETVRLLGRLNAPRRCGLWQLSLQAHKLGGFR